MPFLSDVHSSIWGKTEKAVLIINYDLPKKKIEVDNSEETNLDNTASNLELLKKPIKLPEKQQTHILKVQYNPSTISIQANSEDVPFTFLQQNIDAAIPTNNLRPPSMVLSVDLIFDDVNNKDAFMFEKFRLTTVGDAISSAGGIYRNLNKDGYTVMPQTNGLLAMVLRKQTCENVTFKWADMSFAGKVTEMNARYTMFSVSGKPIRSVVSINISQDISPTGSSIYWNNAFDKCFGKAEKTIDSSLKIKPKNFSNLINIQF